MTISASTAQPADREGLPAGPAGPQQRLGQWGRDEPSPSAGLRLQPGRAATLEPGPVPCLGSAVAQGSPKSPQGRRKVSLQNQTEKQLLPKTGSKVLILELNSGRSNLVWSLVIH